MSNGSDWDIFLSAVKLKQNEMAVWLIKHGADPTIENQQVDPLLLFYRSCLLLVSDNISLLY